MALAMRGRACASFIVAGAGLDLTGARADHHAEADDLHLRPVDGGGDGVAPFPVRGRHDREYGLTPSVARG